jgi:hypothetical protein
MTAETHRGGPELPFVAPETIVVSPIPHPSEIVGAAYALTLDRAAERYAPGAASASWDQWPADPRSTAHTPSMLRIGTTQGHPVLLPGVGQGHILVGNPKLAAPVRPTPPSYGQHTSRELIRRAEEDARTDTQERNRERLAQLEQERQKATDITAGLTTRALASVAPGELEVVVYDPHESGAATSAFSPLAENGQYTNIGLGGLDSLLVRINKEIRARYQTSLDGFPSMHARTTLTGEAAPVPWQLVALIGDGEQLSPQNQKLLDNIVRHGSTVGISLLIHGFRTPDEPSVHRLHLDGNYATSPSVCASTRNGPAHHNVNLWFATDDRPSPQVMWSTANAVARGPRPAARPMPAEPEVHMEMLVDDEVSQADPDTILDRPPQTEEEPAVIVRPTAEEYRRQLPWVQYRSSVTHRARDVIQVGQLTNRFNANHPWWNPTTLQAVTNREPRDVREEASAHANNMGAFLAEARKRFADNDTNAVDRVQIAADLQLLRDQRTTFQNTRNFGMLLQARDTLTHEMPRLIELVTVTQQHGTNEIAEFIRGHIEVLLPDEPPAWAYYAVLEASRGMVGNPDAARAIHYDIQQTFGDNPHVATMFDERGRLTAPRYANAMAELRLLQLYGYTGLAPEDEILRTTLTRHAELHLRGIDPETVPPQLQPIYAACQEHLKVIGETVTAGDRVSGAVGALTSVLWTKGETTGNDDDKDGKPASADSPAK